MWTWWIASNNSNKGKIYTRQCIQSYERKNYKNWKSKSLLGLDSSEDTPNFTNHEISESNMRCNIFIGELCKDISKIFELLKELNVLVRYLNKIDNRHGEYIFGVCKKFIRKLTDYFFMIIDLGTASFGNGSLFTQINENAPLINVFGPMHIDFDEYLPYSGGISEFFETNVNDNIQCNNGYAYYSSKQKYA